MISYSLNIKYVFYIILVYPFFKTYFFSELGIMPYVDQFLFILVLISIIFLYLLKLPYINFSSGMLFIIIYYLIVLYPTMLNNSINFDYFSLIAFSIGFALLTNHSVSEKKTFLYFLSAIYLQLYIYVVLNLFSILIFPNGIPSITTTSEPYYLFGNTNSVIKVVLPGLCFAFLYDLLKYKKIRTKSWLLLALIWITHLITWSITSMIGLFVFTFFIMKKVGTRQVFFNYLTVLLVSIGLSIMIILFKYQSNLLANIVGFFGKDLTFTNRDMLWENSIASIKASPLFGYGVLNANELWNYTGNSSGSHNYYLDTLIRGGIVTFSFLFLGLVYFGKKIITKKNNYVVRTITGASCAYFVMCISEPFMNKEYLMFSILFILISRIDTILKYYYET